MAGVDSLLSLMVQQGADELRLGVERAPKMFRGGAPQRLTVPPTTEEALRYLLGDLLPPSRDAELRRGGSFETHYDAPTGAYAVVFVGRGEAGFDVTFFRGGKARAVAVRPADEVTAHLPSSPLLPAAEAPIDEATPTVGGPPKQVAPIAAPTTEPLVDEATVSGVVPSALRAVSAAGPTPTGGVARAKLVREPTQLPSLLTDLLTRAVALGASDVHLMVGEPPVMRVDGALGPVPDGPPVADALVAALLTPGAQADLAEGRSADYGLDLGGGVRARVNVFRASRGNAASVRLLARTVPELAQLNLPVPLNDLVDLPHGLVILCGPTGSGKSSTLAALAREALRRRGPLLITLEDPIEYVFDARGRGLVRQREIGRDVRDFPTGLRDALREDPDVLLIGEMRDPETISLALTAAETGHLVLTSLHSRSTASAVERIVDAYPPERQGQVRVQLADALRVVVAQRLVPRAHGAGRLPAVEVLRATHSVANLIREGRTAQIATALQSGRKEGMIALERVLADFVRGGQITPAAARAAANDATALAGYLQG